MKNKILSFVGSRLEGRKGNTQRTSNLSPTNHQRYHRTWGAIFTLVMLFTFAIGQMWGAISKQDVPSSTFTCGTTAGFDTYFYTFSADANNSDTVVFSAYDSYNSSITWASYTGDKNGSSASWKDQLYAAASGTLAVDRNGTPTGLSHKVYNSGNYYTVRSTRTLRYLVTNCTGVSISGYISSSKKLYLKAYVVTSGTPAASAVKTAEITSSSQTTTSIDGLTASNTYLIELSGSADENKHFICEVAFVYPHASGGDNPGDEPGDDPGDTPTNYTVTHTLTNVAKTSGETSATEGTAYEAVFKSGKVGYALPSTIGVTIGGNDATVDEDYTWNASTGAFQVPADKVTGNIVVTITGVAPTKTTKSTYTDFTQVGETNAYYTYLNEENYNAYAVAGWMVYEGESKGSAKLLINPETEEAINPSSNSSYGKVKQVGAKYMEFYLTGVTSVKFYFHNGGSESRTAKYKLNNGSEVDLVAVTNGTSNSGIIEDLDPTAENTIRVYASGDIYLCAIKVTLPVAQTTYSVTYEENGHGAAQTDLTGQTALPDPLPTLSESGWTFGGWFTDNGTFETAAVAGATLTANATLYAKWTEVQVANPIISGAVNEDGWGTVSDAITVTANSTIAISDNVLTCDEKTLTATAADATAEYTYTFDSWSGVTNGQSVTADVTATANFTRTPVNYTLEWNSNGGSELSGTYTSGTVAYGAEITKPANPTRPGHTFVGWAESTTGDAVVVPATMPAANKAYYAKWDEITCPTEGTVYSLLLKNDVENASLAKNGGTLNLTSTHVTVTNGVSALIKNTDTGTDGKMQIKNQQFYFNGNNAYLKIVMQCALAAGDEIEMTGGNNSREFYITPNECAKPSDDADAVKTSGYKYTVKATDTKLIGVSTLYIGRDGSSTYTTGVTVTRPEKFDITYWKNDGTTTKTVVEGTVIAANSFSREGYRFIEWNTQADGEGDKVNVGAEVTADTEVFAIWAQEFGVSYANTGAASGAAPTNENKYLANETFKVAGVGSMVAAENYVFGGWNDGTAIYQEDDDYTVTGTVSFVPVWNLQYTVTYKANGGTGDDIIVDNPATIADCVFGTPENKLFDKWNVSSEGDEANYAVGADVSATLVLYAIWKDDECTTNRKSIFKAVMTGDATATVTGENGKEYAGEVLLNKLGGSNSNRNTDASIEGVGSGLTTYKMNGTGAYMYGTLKKGAFQEGDKIQFAVSSTPGTLAIYGAKSSDLSQRVHIADMPAPNAAKVFTYTLTAANAAALAGYDAIGIYRADGVTMNPYMYSLEITGCRDWTILYDVTFNLNGQSGTAPEAQSLAEGATVTKPADPAVDGQFFRGWYKEAACTNAWDFANDVVGDENLTLYAKWEADACIDRKSLSKVVLTSASAGTVTGHNNDEYAGDAIINNLGGNGGSAAYDFGDGDVTGYKLAGTKSTLMATLAKGEFQEGDKVVIAVAQKAGDNKLEIYAGSDKDNVMLVKTLDAAAAGIYTYTLTDADATAINAAGYKSIGTFRGNYNPFVYSVEITGCRTWSIYHTLTFKNAAGTATIAAPSLAEGEPASTVAPVAPVVDDKFCIGWSESVGGTPVDMSAYTITEDKVLYAVYDDCPTYGTIFKLAIKTGLDNGNVFGTTPNSMELTTENYLAELENGSVTAAVSGSDNNRIQYYDGKGLGFYSGNQGSLTITLDCPMKTGDVIRYINYAASNNKLKLSSNSEDVQVDGNGEETIQTIDVPAEWNNQRTIVLSRGNNTPKFTYFEIYRRPVLTGIEIADMTMRVNQALAPQVTLLPEGALVTSQSWEITGREGAANAQINNTTGVISAGSETGTLTVKATFNGDKVATCTVTIINLYESLVPVTGTTNWNWAGAASSETKINDVANRGLILANYINGANFEKLEGKENERAYRSNTYPGYQGTQLHFVTTVPGMLKITARNSGSGQRIAVNTHEVTISDLTETPTEYSIVVPSGDVYITATGGEVRIYSMIFDTDLDPAEAEESTLGGYERDVRPGYYGTICLPKAGVMTGATLYEIAYRDLNDPYKKIFFDEVLNGTMQAGVPYIFLPNEDVTRLGVYYTNTEVENEAKSANGLYGYYDLNNDDPQAAYPIAADQGNYIIKDNQYREVTVASAYIVQNRAYIKTAEINPTYIAPQPNRRRVAINGAPSVATDIDNIYGNDTKAQKVLINGQLFIIRGEKMYDAAGQLVK